MWSDPVMIVELCGALWGQYNLYVIAFSFFPNVIFLSSCFCHEQDFCYFVCGKISLAKQSDEVGEACCQLPWSGTFFWELTSKGVEMRPEQQPSLKPFVCPVCQALCETVNHCLGMVCCLKQESASFACCCLISQVAQKLHESRGGKNKTNREPLPCAIFFYLA